MCNKLIVVFSVCMGLIAPATEADAGLFSATGGVIAILAGELFVGEAEGHLSGAGTLTIHSQKNRALTCLGEFASSAELGGSGQMRCSDGATATFHFQRLSMRSGYGVGSFSRGPMSFVYGLTADEATPYLALPEGKRLTHDGAEPELIDL